jgi:ATP synthase I chain
MSEEFEPVEAVRQPATMSHKRILVLMAVLVVAGTFLGMIFGSLRFGFGVFTGGALAFINYYWLKHTLKRIFEKAKEGQKPRLFAFSYIARYIVFGLLLGIIYLSRSIPVTAVIAGLGSFAIAVVIEGFLRIFNSFNKRDI